MLDRKVYELITEKIHELHDETYNDMDGIYRRIQEELRDFYSMEKNTNLRLDAIEKSIAAQGIGVQNVYNKFLELEKLIVKLNSKEDEVN